MADPSAAPREGTGLLHERLVSLAGTPDDSSQVATDLIVIAQLAATRVAGIEYASVTSRHEGAYATVAASNDFAVVVDQAQYADNAGPCLEALDGGTPQAVPDIAITMKWPGFRDTAIGLGLTSSLSIPLFAGSGQTIAALNLYGRDPAAMRSLTAAVWAVYDIETPGVPAAGLDPGGRELIDGLAGAFDRCSLIQQAVGVVSAAIGCATGHAYLTLRTRAATTGASLADIARQVIADNQRQR